MPDKGYTLISQEMLSELALKVAAILEGNSISRLIPKETAEWLREKSFGYAQEYQFVMPMAGSSAIRIKMKLNIDGSLEIELADTAGYVFWRGTLKEMK